MKKFLNVAVYISLGVFLLVGALILHGENALAFEYHASSVVMNVLALGFIGASAIFAVFAERLNFAKNDNADVGWKLFVWILLLAIGVMSTGYWDAEFDNPYL